MYNGTGKNRPDQCPGQKGQKPRGPHPGGDGGADRLRREYIAAYRASLVSQLENTYIVEPDGTKHKLGKKP